MTEGSYDVQRSPLALEKRRDVTPKPNQTRCRWYLPLSIAAAVDQACVVGIHYDAPPETQPTEPAQIENAAEQGYERAGKLHSIAFEFTEDRFLGAERPPNRPRTS